MVLTTPTPASLCVKHRCSGQRRRRFGLRLEANRFFVKCVPPLPMAGESRATHLTLASEDETLRLCNAFVPEKQILPNTGSALEIGESDSKEHTNGSSASYKSGGVRRRQRCVCIDPLPPTIYEITPYAEIYGALHPREFVFDRDYSLVPGLSWTEMASASHVEETDDVDNDTDDDEDGGWWYQYTI